MKKIIITLITIIAFSFYSNAQCDKQSTYVSNSCGMSGCFYVEVQLTGSLETDMANGNATGGTFRRGLNLREALAVANALESYC